MKKIFSIIFFIETLISCNNSPAIPANSIYQKGDVVYSIDYQAFQKDSIPEDFELIYREEMKKIFFIDNHTGITNTYSIKRIEGNRYITMDGVTVFVFENNSINVLQGEYEISRNHIFKTIQY